MDTPRPIPRRVYQAIALVALAAPCGFTAWIAPRVYSAVGGGALGVLAVVSVLLGAVIVYGIALLPLRRASDLAPLGSDLARLRTEGLGAALQRERSALDALATARDPRLRRRYHTRMALGGTVVTLALGAGTAAMLLEPDAPAWLALPVGAAASAGLTLYHAVRAVLAR